MVKKKAQSKRVSLSQKYKIERKVREHNRKVRKEAKKMQLMGGGKKSSLKKDPGIPNLWPFKEELLQQMERRKQKQEEQQQKQKDAREKEIERRRMMSLKDLQRDAAARGKDFEKKEKKRAEDEESGNGSELSRRAYFRELNKVIETADVILEVLDARDPLGCRCPELEAAILGKDPNKKIVLVLNKIDLVPKEVVEKWLKYLRREYATVAFKSSTGKGDGGRAGAGSGGSDALSTPEQLLQSSRCLGADTLLQLLKNYSRSSHIKTAISVGIIGYPNVGKSSLINSLKRARAVAVGNTPGLTKVVQEVQLDKKVKLLDCPGIIFSGSAGSRGNENPNMVLRNVVKVEHVEDPVGVATEIYKRCHRDLLLRVYQIPSFADASEFLANVARKRGKLGKGGVLDMAGAARAVLVDWVQGRIPYYSDPPEVKEDEALAAQAQIVAQWGQAIDLQALESLEKSTVFEQLQPQTHSEEAFMRMQSSGSGTLAKEEEEKMDDEEEDMEDGSEMESMDDDEDEDDEFDDDDDDDDDDEEEEIETETPAPAALLQMADKKTKKGGPVAVSKGGLGVSKFLDGAHQANQQQNLKNKLAEKQRRKEKRKGASDMMD